jgi:hypothetical protein
LRKGLSGWSAFKRNCGKLPRNWQPSARAYTPIFTIRISTRRGFYILCGNGFFERNWWRGMALPPAERFRAVHVRRRGRRSRHDDRGTRAGGADRRQGSRDRAPRRGCIEARCRVRP